MCSRVLEMKKICEVNMKNWYLLLLVGLVSCTAPVESVVEKTPDPYEMRCGKLQDTWFRRCENKEVVCYHRSQSSLQCFMKKEGP